MKKKKIRDFCLIQFFVVESNYTVQYYYYIETE